MPFVPIKAADLLAAATKIARPKDLACDADHLADLLHRNADAHADAPNAILNVCEELALLVKSTNQSPATDQVISPATPIPEPGSPMVNPSVTEPPVPEAPVPEAPVPVPVVKAPSATASEASPTPDPQAVEVASTDLAAADTPVTTE